MASATDRRPAQPGDPAVSASGRLQTWGYHNTFSTHSSVAPDAEPPSYQKATARLPCDAAQHVANERLPGYSCDVHMEGFLDVRTELASPFLISLDNDWHRIYVELHGTQLNVYRLKRSLFRSRAERQGRLLRSYSLQHAEVGVAVDWIKGDLVPKAAFARVLPRQAQLKLYESDPDLFEPIREFVFRLRIEQEQLIFCASSHAEMLDWVEELCVGIDISPPLDDRHEPRYRSLPRRTRRQRQIETAAQMGPEGPSREELERQVIAEQEALFRRMYPNLAATTSNEQVRAEAPAERGESERDNSQEPDNNEFDREDALGESPETALASQTTSQSLLEEDEITTPAYDPKTAPTRGSMSDGALCRFRRRCAPILLASSPRASHVIFSSGQRYQIDARRSQLVPFVSRPPRYDAHKPLAIPAVASIAEAEGEDAAQRPALSRGVTVSSQWSSGSTDVEHEEAEASSLHTTNSLHEDLDRADAAARMNAQVGLAKGKARALLTAKMSSNRLRSLPQGYDSELVALAPVLV